MKTVFSTSFEIAHIFANKSQTVACSANTHIGVDWQPDEPQVKYFYSYSTIMAEHITNTKGEAAVMLNDVRYSITTSKHQHELRMATRHLKQFFRTQTDITQVYARISELIENLVPKAKTKKDDYLNEARELLLSFKTFQEWAGAKGWKKEVRYIKACKLVRIGGDSGLLAKYTVAEANQRIKEQKERDRLQAIENGKRLAEYKAALAEWLSGERKHAPYAPSWANAEDYLRMSKGGKFVQTTQGVNIPINSARVLYQMILAGKDIKGYQIEGYSVKGLNGVLTIGCHRINVENMHLIGSKLID